MRIVKIIVCLAVASSASSCSGDDDLYVVCQQTCYTGRDGTEGVGQCRAGTPTCDEEGNVIECDGEVLPSQEVCDGIDNDCDGRTDESLRIGWTDEDNRCLQCGPCRRTQEVCKSGAWVCEYSSPPADKDDTCDGIDDDCDCQTDEDVYEEGEVVFCYTGSSPDDVLCGECRPGIEACVNGQTVCEGEQTPREEACNQVDDDCNCIVDDVTVMYDYVAMVLAIDVSGSMVPYNEAVRNVICNYASQGANQSYRFALVLIAEPDGEYTLAQDMTDAQGLCDALTTVESSGGHEPTLSVAEAVTDPSNPLSISWPEESKRLFIGFGDEQAQVVAPSDGSLVDPEVGIEASIVNTLAHCAATETAVYWFVQDDLLRYQEQAEGCEGRVFQLTSYEQWMLDDLNSIIEEVCLAPSP